MCVESLAAARYSVNDYPATVYALTRIQDIGDDLSEMPTGVPPDLPTFGEKLLQLIRSVGLLHKGEPNQSAFARRMGLPVSRINAHITGHHAFAKPDFIRRCVETLNEIAREQNLPRTFSEADLTVGIATPSQRAQGNGKVDRENHLKKPAISQYKIVAPNTLTRDTASSLFSESQGAHGAQDAQATVGEEGCDFTSLFQSTHDPIALGHALFARARTLDKIIKIAELLQGELESLGAAFVAGQIAVSVPERSGHDSPGTRPARRADGGTPPKSS